MAHKEGIAVPAVLEFRSLTGYGVYVRTQENREIYVGKEELAREHSENFSQWHEGAQELAAKGRTPMYVVADCSLPLSAAAARQRISL